MVLVGDGGVAGSGCGRGGGGNGCIEWEDFFYYLPIPHTLTYAKFGMGEFGAGGMGA